MGCSSCDPRTPVSLAVVVVADIPIHHAPPPPPPSPVAFLLPSSSPSDWPAGAASVSLDSLPPRFSLATGPSGSVVNAVGNKLEISGSGSKAIPHETAVDVGVVLLFPTTTALSLSSSSVSPNTEA